MCEPEFANGERLLAGTLCGRSAPMTTTDHLSASLSRAEVLNIASHRRIKPHEDADVRTQLKWIADFSGSHKVASGIGSNGRQSLRHT